MDDSKRSQATYSPCSARASGWQRAGTQLLSTQPDSSLAAKTGESVLALRQGTHGLRIGRHMTRPTGRLATAIVQRDRERFERGPTLARAHIESDFAVVVLGDVQTEVGQICSLPKGGEVESVELCVAGSRQMATDEFCVTTEAVVGGRSSQCSATTTLLRTPPCWSFCWNPADLSSPGPGKPRRGSALVLTRASAWEVRGDCPKLLRFAPLG